MGDVEVGANLRGRAVAALFWPQGCKSHRSAWGVPYFLALRGAVEYDSLVFYFALNEVSSWDELEGSNI
jgi:hypothetical protein